jgi:archaellum component FlaC
MGLVGDGKIDLNDIDALRQCVQGVTQVTNCSGKLVEMFDEDLESMGKEFETWTKIWGDSRERLREREKEIDKDLKGLGDKVTEKEEAIKERREQIRAVKTQSLKNDQKIERLLRAIVASS